MYVEHFPQSNIFKTTKAFLESLIFYLVKINKILLISNFVQEPLTTKRRLDTEKDTVSVVDLHVPKGEVTYTVSITFTGARVWKTLPSGPSWYPTPKRRVKVLTSEFRKLMQS